MPRNCVLIARAVDPTDEAAEARPIVTLAGSPD
jgi:hypothetical protein